MSFQILLLLMDLRSLIFLGKSWCLLWFFYDDDPGFVTMIPQYVLFSKIGWVGTYLPLIVPSFFGNAFNIFLMRQFYLSINNELIEAAEIDGANHLYIWSHLMLPLTKPALITIAINSFNAAWNDFLGPLLYIQDQENTRYRLACKFFRTKQRHNGIIWWQEQHLSWSRRFCCSFCTTLFHWRDGFDRRFKRMMNRSIGKKPMIIS